MKPTKNRIYCYGCKKTKMLFPAKEKADNFMNFNKEDILEDCQIELLLEDKSFRNQKSAWQNLSNILEVKKLLRMIQSADECIYKGDYPAAKNIHSQCKDVIAGFSGMGKTLIQDFFKTKIEERERMCPTSTKAYAKSVTQSKSCPSKSHSDNPHYKKAILSIIERIELATTAYQHNDMSSCETHIEIADFMLDELGLTDENIEILVRQLDKLKQLINEKK